MNKVILMGRLTQDPMMRHSEQVTIARYTLAVGRKAHTGEQEADFIQCTAFGKNAEFAEKWLHKGIKILLTGRISTGSYTDRDGRRVYTTEVIAEEQEFAESKAAERSKEADTSVTKQSQEGFLDIPESVYEELPFN